MIVDSYFALELAEVERVEHHPVVPLIASVAS